MANPANNPLFKHFRQPAIYLRLPSRGKFYSDQAIDFPATGEIPVYPMTVKDEITLKTPDALMNGEGMVTVVQSCCPNIKDPWAIPAIDVDSIFIAIRLASYGQGMDIRSTCPNCQSVNENTVDLRYLLDNLKYADYNKECTIKGLKFLFKPQTYKDINQLNIITFEERKLIDGIINNPDLTDEQKAQMFKESLSKLNNLNINSIVSNIQSITTDDNAIVSDQNQIAEFLENCSREIYSAIKSEIEKLIKENKTDPINITCSECETPYTTNLEFDQSNFFE